MSLDNLARHSVAARPTDFALPHLQLVTSEMEPGALVEVVRHAAPHGLDSVQLRLRGRPARQVLAVGEELRRVLRPLKIPLLVNDRLDLALALDLQGVHLRADGLPLEVTARLWRRLHPGSPPVLGRSIHSRGEAEEAGRATYLTFGHVFETSSKRGVPGRGLEQLAHAVRGAAAPVLAIGGITPDRVVSVLAAGAAGVAVRSYITEASDPAGATRALRNALDEAWQAAGRWQRRSHGVRVPGADLTSPGARGASR